MQKRVAAHSVFRNIAWALQNAIFNSANFSSIATDKNGVIRIFNVGAERMLGYAAADVINKFSPLDIVDLQEVAARAEALSAELGAPVMPGFEALVFKASRGVEDIYELTLIRKDGSRLPAVLSVTALRNARNDIIGYLLIDTDSTARKQADEKLLYLALHDVLTQLPNRRLLNERLAQAMATSKRSGRYGALMFLDLDNFKSLNDTFGHCVGDLLLVEVAHRISSCLREVDFIARFGGDEFVVILGDLDEDKAASSALVSIVAEKIRNNLSKPCLLKFKSQDQIATTIEHHCTPSIGVALFLDNEVSIEEIIQWADTAMYQGKKKGGNSIIFYEA